MGTCPPLLPSLVLSSQAEQTLPRSDCLPRTCTACCSWTRCYKAPQAGHALAAHSTCMRSRLLLADHISAQHSRGFPKQRLESGHDGLHSMPSHRCPSYATWATLIQVHHIACWSSVCWACIVPKEACVACAPELYHPPIALSLRV